MYHKILTICGIIGIITGALITTIISILGIAIIIASFFIFLIGKHFQNQEHTLDYLSNIEKQLNDLIYISYNNKKED